MPKEYTDVYPLHTCKSFSGIDLAGGVDLRHPKGVY